MNYDELATKIYKQNKAIGWWDNPNRCIYECLQLVSTEIAEATEGERKNLMDDHLPDRKMGEVELADALIRLLDLAGKYGWKYKTSPVQYYLTVARLSSPAGLHFSCTTALCDLGGAIERRYHDDQHDQLSKHYSAVINTILCVSETLGYDVDSAMLEKIEYNKTRQDRTREARAKVNGKRF